MARDREERCKKCRRLNTKLYLKGERCYSSKCSLEKGKSGFSRGRGRSSQYARELREKQKLRWMYGLSEGQLKRYFQMAERSLNVTGEEFLRLLERRLDNVVYRLGFSLSRDHARQWVNHGHVLVNGRKVNIPSYLVREGDTIEARRKSRKLLKEVIQIFEKRPVPEWLDLDKESLMGRIRRFPRQEELNQELGLPLIAEYYSRD